MSQPNSLYLLIRWLTLTAVVEWLINRSLTRFAIFMPKSGPVLALYQALTLVGQFAFTLTGLLALVAIGWLAWQRRKAWRGALSLVLLALLLSSLTFVLVQPRDWLVVGYQLLMLAAITLLAWQLPRASVLPAAGLFLGELYQLSAALGNTLHLTGPVPFTSPLFNLGELAVAVSPFVLWFAFARGRASTSIWLLAAILPLSFATFYYFQPAMAGIMAIWSMGLTLYLPWPIYAVSLWLAGVTLAVGLRLDNRTGWAIMLLAAGGYAPQISTYAFLGLVALWLLAEESAPSVHLAASRPFPSLSKLMQSP